MGSDFWSVQLRDFINFAILVATVAAIVWGPIWALRFQAKNVDSAYQRGRKREIAATLMRTRMMTMHPDHVGALNLIQLEFAEDKKIMRAFRAYLTNLSDPVPADPRAVDILLQRRRDLFFELLSKIGRNLGIKIDRVDLERLAYVPIGWTNDENEQRQLRRAAIEIFEGRKPLGVSDFVATNTRGPFPPPP